MFKVIAYAELNNKGKHGKEKLVILHSGLGHLRQSLQWEFRLKKNDCSSSLLWSFE